MTKHIQEKYKNVKKQIQKMGKTVDKLNLNNSIECLNFSRITNLKNIYEKIIPIIKKYNGVIYGTTIGTSIKNSKIGIRKTDDLDVRFNTIKDRDGFVRDVMKAIGTRDYYTYDGYYGTVICRKSDKSTIIDTHITERKGNNKNKRGYNITTKDAYVVLRTKDKRIKNYCDNIKGETYSVSAQKKYNSVLDDLNIGYSNSELSSKKLKRIGKDALDVRLYNADAYIKAYKMWQTEKDAKKKSKLHKLLNDLGRAILIFSATPEVLENRKIAEKKYIEEGMLNKRTFTSKKRTNKEKELYEKLKRNPSLDLTKYGTEWLESDKIQKTKITEKQPSLTNSIRKMI